jgi:hypothetical protein
VIWPLVGAAIGVSAAPTLASFLASSLAGGAGLGVIGVGIAAAVKSDKSIEEAGKTAAERFSKGLQSAAGPALSGPVKESLGLLAAAGDRLNVDLGKTFQALSGKVVPFTEKLIMAAEAITGPLLGAARDSGPAIDAIGDGLVYIAGGVGDFIEAVADGGPEAADNIRLIAGAIGDTIAVTGELLGWLNKVSSIPFATGPLSLLKEHYADASKESKGLSDQTVVLAAKMSNAEKAARGEAGALSNLSKELRAQVDPTFALIRNKSKLAEAQKAVTDAEDKHGRKSPKYREALRQAAEAALDLEAAAGKVASTSNGRMTPALYATLRAAGFTEKEVNDLAGQFRGAKKDGDRFAKRYQAAAGVSGVAGARRSVRGIIDDLRRFAHKWTATMTVHYKQFGKPYSKDGVDRGQVGGLASGGPVTGPGPKGVDSQVRVLAPGEHVWTAAEVDAVGGHPAVMQLRRAARGGGRMSAPAPGAGGGGNAMPAGGDGGGWVYIRGDAVMDGIIAAIADRVGAKGGRAAQLGIKVLK